MTIWHGYQKVMFNCAFEFSAAYYPPFPYTVYTHTHTHTHMYLLYLYHGHNEYEPLTCVRCT